jgi:prepilin-type N-terminal cleavage/methylation domain-containing protein
VQKEKTQMKLNTHRSNGFTLVEIMVTVTILGVLSAIVIPNFVNARSGSETKSCISNLRLINAGITQWAFENRVAPSASVTQDMLQPYVSTSSAGTWPKCPAGGTYTVATAADSATCTVSGHVLTN